jgi:hypothetical protein
VEVLGRYAERMGVQHGSFNPNQGKHDPILARQLQPGEAVTSCGFGALVMPMLRPMTGKVYVTTSRVAVVLDGGRMWNATWADITRVTVKKSLLAATALIQTSGGEQWGVDSTKSVAGDIERAWSQSRAR